MTPRCARRESTDPLALERRVLRRWRTRQAPPSPTIVVGFSGGPDSLALASVLARIARRGAFKVVACHVNHRLRSSSAAEAAQAQALAQALGIDCIVRTADEPPAGTWSGLGQEEWARRLRFAALASVCRDLDTRYLALAHHSLDQAETVLLHLVRGAGLHGVAGMREWSTLLVPWWSDDRPYRLDVWRPLLAEPRPLVHAVATALGVTPVVDSSNRDPSLRRNRIRHEVIPLLEEIAPGATDAMVRFANVAAEEDAQLDRAARAAAQSIVDGRGDLSISALDGQPTFIRRRVVRQWLTAGPLSDVPSLERVDAVLGLARSPKGGHRIELADGREVRRQAGRLIAGFPDQIERRLASSSGALVADRPIVEPILLQCGKPVRVQGWTLDLTGDRPQSTSGLDVVWETPIEEDDPIVVRSPQTGDRLAGRATKLGDWLTDQRVPVVLRDRLLCIVSPRGVIGVLGLRPLTPRGNVRATRWIVVLRERAEEIGDRTS